MNACWQDGWKCQHAWPEIKSMVAFRNATRGQCRHRLVGQRRRRHRLRPRQQGLRRRSTTRPPRSAAPTRPRSPRARTATCRATRGQRERFGPVHGDARRQHRPRPLRGQVQLLTSRFPHAAASCCNPRARYCHRRVLAPSRNAARRPARARRHRSESTACRPDPERSSRAYAPPCREEQQPSSPPPCARPRPAQPLAARAQTPPAPPSDARLAAAARAARRHPRAVLLRACRTASPTATPPTTGAG